MKIDKQSSCSYYYNQPDASLWWNLPYYKALQIKRNLCQIVIDELCKEHFLKRDAERINRCLKVIKDIEKQLKDVEPCLKH